MFVCRKRRIKCQPGTEVNSHAAYSYKIYFCWINVAFYLSYVEYNCLFIMTFIKKSLKIQKDKQRFTKHIYKPKDHVTRTSIKTGVDSGAPEG